MSLGSFVQAHDTTRPRPMIQPARHLTFGAGGSAAPYLGPGWSHPEADFTWTEGTHSRLRLPVEATQEAVCVEIGLSPMIHKPRLPHQDLIVSVNDVAIGHEQIAAECAVSLDIPHAALAGKHVLDIVLHCPTAASPSVLLGSTDRRVLGVAVRDIRLWRQTRLPGIAPSTRPPLPQDLPMPDAVREATGLSLADLAMRFESLGHDCEFGLAQRQMGTETLGLLRFAGLSPRQLITALDRGFAGIEAPGNLSVFTHDPGHAAEFMVRDHTYGLVVHTHRHAHQTDADTLLAAMHQRFRFLRDKLMQDLADGDKIAVFNYPGTKSVNQMRPLLNRLRSLGPNTMLFVTDDGAEPPGTVRRVDTDLLVGWIGELGRERAGLRLDLAGWVSLCANAVSMCQTYDRTP